MNSSGRLIEFCKIEVGKDEEKEKVRYLQQIVVLQHVCDTLCMYVE
jgi:hypothetical protein